MAIRCGQALGAARGAPAGARRRTAASMRDSARPPFQSRPETHRGAVGWGIGGRGHPVLRSPATRAPPLARRRFALASSNPPDVEAHERKSVTQQIMEEMDAEQQSGGAGGTTTWDGLLRAEENWARMRNMVDGEPAGPEVVVAGEGPLSSDPSFDVCVCGGTLGIFVACSLQLRGWRVAVVERGKLRGRLQEWNVSRAEMRGLIDLGVLTSGEVDTAITSEWNPVRCSFHGAGDGEEVQVRDVLNTGISPVALIDAARGRFEAAGGVVMEGVGAERVTIKPDGAEVALTTGETLVSRLVVDAMGHYSPIVRQIRWGKKPDGVCMVVGSCARGFDRNDSSDLLMTTEGMRMAGGAGSRSPVQYFWEAFPAGSGPRDRTTYMFAYLDAHPERHTLLDMLEDYWDAMPRYQGVELGDLKVLRVLFGFFPTFKSQSPLPAAFDRVIQVGDASGIQSPLSFGGFGSITRHLPRLTAALSEALDSDLLTRGDLRAINAYQPNLGTSWMNQRAMGARVGQKLEGGTVNRLLSCNFRVMQQLGPRVTMPFLQDVVQLIPLASTMAGMTARRPFIAMRTLGHVGPGPFFSWFFHFHMLAAYTLLHVLLGGVMRWVAKVLPRRAAYRVRRAADALKYGAGLDYHYVPPSAAA